MQEQTEKKLTGYPSIDKPWLKYYSEEAINAPLPECTIYEYLWENNKENLDAVALEYYGAKISYQKLFDNIELAAKAFAALGIKRGDIVIVASVTLPEVIYSIYALNRLGAIPNMVDPRTSIEGIRDYITEVEASLVLTIDVAYPKILKASEKTTVKQIVTISATDSMPLFSRLIVRLKSRNIQNSPLNNLRMKWSSFIKVHGGADYLSEPYSPQKCCMIVHTGGTTGTPKGVMLSDDNANAAFFQAIHSPIQMQRGDVFLNIMPPFIAYGMILGIHIALCWGWKSVIIPKFDPDMFDKLLLKYKPNGLIGVPSYFEKLMASNKLKTADLSFVKCLLAGGDKTPEDFEKRINAFLQEHRASIHLSKGYSLTEASAMATISYESTVKEGSCGIPLPKTVITAFDEGTDNEIPRGELGEICMNSPTIMMGYYQNETATAEILKTHNDGSKWIHTGDLGRLDEDGLIYIEGRIKRIIVRYDGFKVFPSMIEKTVSQHPEIEQCCAVGVPDGAHRQGHLPVVYVVLKPSSAEKKSKVMQDLREYCQKELPEYAQPVEWHFSDCLPLTPIGKIDYRALERAAQSR